MHVIAAKAQAFGEALEPSFREYQTQVVSNAAARERPDRSRLPALFGRHRQPLAAG